jgi:hypothetical protein
LLSFYFLYNSTAKTFLLKDFQIKIHFFIFLLLGAFFGKKFGSKKVPHLKFILLNNHFAEKAEYFISVSRTHAGKRKKNGLSKCLLVLEIQPFKKLLTAR